MNPPAQVSCRRCLEATQTGEAHAGLLLAFALRDHQADNAARRALFERAQRACGRALPVYRLAFDRWQSLTDAGPFRSVAIVSTARYGRLISGLGSESVLETGLRLHHTYGVPFLPASGLKGLAAHYAHQAWGATDSEWKQGGAKHAAVFGTQKDAGHAQFEDGLILPESIKTCLREDVMTPHHADYYMAAKDDVTTAPGDFDAPIPITYLSVAGSFRIVVGWDAPENPKGWCDLVLQLLLEALADRGFGGKTSSGYGRLLPRS